jgi:gluconolactonase
MRVTPTGRVSTFAHEYRGAPFRGPNDLAFDAQGNLFFSDPIRREMPDPCISPIYRVSPRGDVSVFASDIAFPNGLALSPDGTELYVAEMRSNRLLAFPITSSGTAGDPRLLYRFHEPAWPDGMAVDSDGVILQALRGSGAIAYVCPSRRRLIDVWARPDWAPSNLAFGGEGNQTVFVTDQEGGRVFTFCHGVPGRRPVAFALPGRSSA